VAVQDRTAAWPPSARAERAGEGGDVLGGTLRKGAPRLPCGRAEPARGGTALRHPSQHGAQDADLLRAAGLPAHEAAFAPQARRFHRDHRHDPGGGPHGTAQAAAHGQADPRAAAGRAGLRRRLHDREGLRARAACPCAGGVRAAGPPARPRPGRLRRSGGGDRGCPAEDPLFLPRPAALGRLLHQGLPGRAHRGLLRRPQRGLRLPRRRAAIHPLRQHQAGGGPHLGRRHAPENAQLRRAAVALPVPRPLRPPWQGQRQGPVSFADIPPGDRAEPDGGRPGRLRPAQLPGADPRGRQLRRAQPPS
jgi:hypothetical protein